MIRLKILGSATTARDGFPLKVVNDRGQLLSLATCEAHARRIIRSMQEILDRHPHYRGW
jgi:hypothetical protein